MLKKIFNTLSQSCIPQRPMVMVSTLGDDPSRGDSHAYMRLGQRMADMMGGDYHYIDQPMLAAHYPQTSYPLAALSLYVEETGTPDIVFARDRLPWVSEKDTRRGGKRPFVIQNINECMSLQLGDDPEHVTHHLTPSLLAAEGAKFRAAYPDMPQQIVAVMVADQSMGYNVPETLIPALDEERTGIFICTSRRTPTKNYQSLMLAMSYNIDKSGAAERLILGGYDFLAGRDQGAYNPYIGLLNEASHILVLGSSKSIVTEALASGKSVYLHENNDPYSQSETNGLVKYFNTLAAGDRLQTGRIIPPNPTESVAARLVEKYRLHCREGLSLPRRVAMNLVARLM